jgi:hypothetical protein
MTSDLLQLRRALGNLESAAVALFQLNEGKLLKVEAEGSLYMESVAPWCTTQQRRIAQDLGALLMNVFDELNRAERDRLEMLNPPQPPRQ